MARLSLTNPIISSCVWLCVVHVCTRPIIQTVSRSSCTSVEKKTGGFGGVDKIEFWGLKFRQKFMARLSIMNPIISSCVWLCVVHVCTRPLTQTVSSLSPKSPEIHGLFVANESYH